MTERWHVAQINVGTTLFETDDERLEGFMSRLDAVNALADESPGFVWRLQSDSGNATDIDVGGDPLFIVNMSVWDSIDALFEFVYKTAHRDVMIRRREWFQRPKGAYQALWWVPAGHVPTPEEGLERLARLNEHGPGEEAFTFQKSFPPPNETGTTKNHKPDPWCSGWA
ncbi:MAG: DUF3291 domain-containing protein [Pseudomonadota bacterium]